MQKEINPENSLEGLMLKLKLQYFGHLMGRTDSLEKTLMPQRVRHDFTFLAWTMRMKLLELQACCENSMRHIIHVDSVLALR